MNIRLFSKTFLTLFSLGVLIFPASVNAQTVVDNCAPGFAATPKGTNSCTCEPQYSDSNPGTCRVESAGEFGQARKGVGCNPGFFGAVITDTDCTCVRSDQKGTCNATQWTWKSFDSEEECVSAGCTSCTDVTVSETTWRGHSCTATSTGPAGSGSGAGTTGVAPRGSKNALDFDVIQNISGVTMPQNLGEIISKFVPYIFGAAGILLFFLLIWGGFSWMTAKGDPKATAAAREKITKAVVGFAIIFTAYWLVQILGKILGITQFQNIFQ